MSEIGFPVVPLERPGVENPIGHITVVGHNIEKRQTGVPCPMCGELLTLVIIASGIAGRCCAMARDESEVYIDVMPKDLEPLCCFACGVDFYRPRA